MKADEARKLTLEYNLAYTYEDILREIESQARRGRSTVFLKVGAFEIVGIVKTLKDAGYEVRRNGYYLDISWF